MTKEEAVLFEKIVRAKVALEGARQQHSSTCAADDDFGPCTCGASSANSKIESALRELK